MLLTLAVVPLAAAMTARERITYRDNQRATTRVIAAVAEEHLSDHKSADPMLDELRAAAQAGDCVRLWRAPGGPTPVRQSRAMTPRNW